MFIEMEKLKLVSLAIQQGEQEVEVCSFLDEENIPDFDLDNLRSRLKIKRSESAKSESTKASEVEESKE